MNNLKSLKNSLKSKSQGFHELSNQEKKQVNGGQYGSLEECKEDCGYLYGGWGIWSGSGTCYVVSASPEIWDCRDS